MKTHYKNPPYRPKINESRVTQTEDGGVVIQLADREEQLRGIAKEFRLLLLRITPITEKQKKNHRRHLGYCEQLEIIADELANKKEKT